MEYIKNSELFEENIEEYKLLYNGNSGENHFLNETAALIWNILPDRFLDVTEYKREFVSKFQEEIDEQILEKDFDECLNSFLQGGLLKKP
jgi:hypothetical protein